MFRVFIMTTQDVQNPCDWLYVLNSTCEMPPKLAGYLNLSVYVWTCGSEEVQIKMTGKSQECLLTLQVCFCLTSVLLSRIRG